MATAEVTECSYRPRIISWTFINLALAFVLFIGDSVNKNHYLIFEAPIQNCFGVFHCNSSPPLLAVATALYIKLILTSMFRQKLHLLQKEKKTQFLPDSQLYRLHFEPRLQFTITLVPKEICDWHRERFLHCPDHVDE